MEQRFSGAILLLGCILFFLSLGQQLLPATSVPITSSDQRLTGFTERDLAIAGAIRQGKTDYSFTTRFIPGIGFVNDPEAYLEQWEEDARKELEAE